jgi:hypothetical protein
MTPKAHRTALVLFLTLSAGPAAAQSLVSGEALAIACGPRVAFEAPEAALAIAGSLAAAQGVYAPWHRLVINAGAEQGIRTGQQFYVRRAMPPREQPAKGQRATFGIVTAGWIRIDAVEAHRSIATIVYECDGMQQGDYLEPFAMPTVPAALPEGEPDFTEPGSVLFGLERRQMEGAGAYVVIDRGSEHGIQPGQHFTVFRASPAGPNIIVARGVAMAVQREATMMKISRMQDYVGAGDRVAAHK